MCHESRVESQKYHPTITHEYLQRFYCFFFDLGRTTQDSSKCSLLTTNYSLQSISQTAFFWVRKELHQHSIYKNKRLPKGLLHRKQPHNHLLPET